MNQTPTNRTQALGAAAGLLCLLSTAGHAQQNATTPAPSATPDYSARILTPPAPATPRINGPRIYGQRPGSPFFYTVPATGDRPMTFAAQGLPRGLALDSKTGIIRGVAAKPGAYPVRLTARNARGVGRKTLRIVIGEKIVLTPPLGWNSWNSWATQVDQEKVLRSARVLVSSDGARRTSAPSKTATAPSSPPTAPCWSESARPALSGATPTRSAAHGRRPRI